VITLRGARSDKRRADGARTKQSRARGAVVAAAVVALAIAAGFLLLPNRSRPGPAAFSAPDRYRITYRVSAPGAPDHIEEMWVDRPFASVVRDLSGGVPYIERVTRLGELVLAGTGPEAALVHVPLMPAPTDIRLDAVLGAALHLHRLVARGTTTVGGQRCQTFRSAAPLASGPLGVVNSGSMYVDSCIDARGLLVGESTVRDGKVVARREAISVAVGLAAGTDRDAAMNGVKPATNHGGGGVRALTLDSRPSSGPFWDVPRAPDGYVHAGRYAVVPSQPQAYEDRSGLNALGVPGSLVASIDDVYVRGRDAIVIEQGSTVNDAKFSPPTGGENIDLGSVLGRGQLLLSASASEVAAEPHEGRRFVRVIGTATPDELIAIARSMRLQPAGTMRPLEGTKP
jgi:hypothetical protein